MQSLNFSGADYDRTTPSILLEDLKDKFSELDTYNDLIVKRGELCKNIMVYLRLSNRKTKL